jgi:hypothetical protein
MSHSTAGRQDLEGEPILPIEHRIWVQDRLKGDFEDMTQQYKDAIVVRVDKDEVIYEIENIDIKEDDQYVGESAYVIFRRCLGYTTDEGCDFVIPPWLIEIKRGDTWISIPYDPDWFPSKRSPIERLAPYIRREFIRLGLDPSDYDDVLFYIEEWESDPWKFGDWKRDPSGEYARDEEGELIWIENTEEIEKLIEKAKQR